MTAGGSIGSALNTLAQTVAASATDVAELAQEAGGQAIGALLEFGDAAKAAGDELARATGQAVAEACGRFVDGVFPELRAAVDDLVEEALPDHLEHAQELLDVLDAGMGIVGPMAAFAPPLDWAHGIVGVIDDLLDAMNLGL